MDYSRRKEPRNEFIPPPPSSSIKRSTQATLTVLAGAVLAVLVLIIADGARELIYLDFWSPYSKIGIGIDEPLRGGLSALINKRPLEFLCWGTTIK